MWETSKHKYRKRRFGSMEAKQTLFEKKASNWTGNVLRVYVVNGFQVRGRLIESDFSGILIEEEKTKREMFISQQNITTMETLDWPEKICDVSELNDFLTGRGVAPAGSVFYKTMIFYLTEKFDYVKMFIVLLVR